MTRPATPTRDEGTEKRAARLRPILVDSVGAAALLSVSPRHLHKLAALGLVPAPCKLGKAVRWPVAVLEAWAKLGCPALLDQSGQIQDDE